MSLAVDNFQNELFETGVFKKFNSEDFNKLKHIEESCKIELNEAVESIGVILQKHGLEQFIGVSRTHNHFQLNENEIVLAKVVSNDGVISNLNSDDRIISLKAINLNELKCKPTPYMWAYDKKMKKFFPVQFFDGFNKDVSNQFEQLASKSESLRKFFDEFILKVEELEMEDNIGIYIFHHKFFKNNNCSMEITNEDKREQWIYPEDKDNFDNIKLTENITTTMWDFSTNQNDFCATHCRNHCRNHCRSHCRRH